MKITNIEKIGIGILIVGCMFVVFNIHRCNKLLNDVQQTTSTVKSVSDGVKNTSKKVQENGGFKQLVINAGKEVKDIKKQINESDGEL